MKSNSNAVAYCRVSTDKQEEQGYSLPSQEKFCRQKAKDSHLELVKIFSGHESAYKPGRKMLQEMLDYIIENDIKHVICYAKDRLSRNPYDNLKIRELQDSFGIQVHFCNHVFSNDAMGRFSEHIIEGTAEFQSRYISERTKTGMIQKLSQGQWCQVAPYGYVNNKETKAVDVDPREAENVRWLYQQYASGNYSLTTLQMAFDSNGRYYIPNHRKITRSNLERILKNQFYIGLMVWDGQTFYGNHEKIISNELFQSVQSVFKAANKPRMSKLTFTYSGLITCERCGCAITSEIKKGQYIYYHCTRGRGDCEVEYVRQEIIDSQVEKMIQQLSFPDKFTNAILKTLRACHKDEVGQNERAISQLSKRKTEILNKIDRAYEDKLDGRIDPEFWETKNAKWRMEIAEIESQIKTFSEPNVNWYEDGIKIIELTKRLYPLWLVQDSTEKRKMVQILLSNLTLDGANLHHNWRKPFNYLVNLSDKTKMRPGQDSNLWPQPPQGCALSI